MIDDHDLDVYTMMLQSGKHRFVFMVREDQVIAFLAKMTDFEKRTDLTWTPRQTRLAILALIDAKRRSDTTGDLELE